MGPHFNTTVFPAPEWEDLAAYLERRYELLGVIDAINTSTKVAQKEHIQSSSSASLKHQFPLPKQLPFFANKQHHSNSCNQQVSHNAFSCTAFMLCLNCLAQHHTVKECSSTNRCLVCQINQHTLLPRNQSSITNEISSSLSPTLLTITTTNEMHQPSSTSTVLQVYQNNKKVLLATAIVQLRSPS
ncbi:unnamed protein product [Ceratitis capitata]|uniref:(Mediterranean fruit fly) hypothetical protein n=1 Tax=Ceratitis capitata TaxID=7213 RepID=A0A811URN2_CERCA|nr:unnamed protein product [Ceratitis capitata]